MTIYRLIFALPLILGFHFTDHAFGAQKNRPLADYILTVDELRKLNGDEHKTYFYFLNYLVSTTEIGSFKKLSDRKVADRAVEQSTPWIELSLLPKAHALLPLIPIVAGVVVRGGIALAPRALPMMRKPAMEFAKRASNFRFKGRDAGAVDAVTVGQYRRQQALKIAAATAVTSAATASNEVADATNPPQPQAEQSASTPPPAAAEQKATVPSAQANVTSI